MPDASFTEFIRDQLGTPPVNDFRRMFGGLGIYRSGVFLGIIYEGRLYFKTTATTRAAYDDAGMAVFQTNARQRLTAYREVPAQMIEDAEQLRRWAEQACVAASRTQGPRRGGRPASQSARPWANRLGLVRLQTEAA